MAADSLDLVINATHGALQLALARDWTLLVSEEWCLENTSAELLAPALNDLCRRLHVHPASFGRIACVHGPGSFTGIRLALTTAMVLRRLGGARLAPLDGLATLAYEAARCLDLPTGTMIAVATHARRNLLHTECFCLGEEGAMHSSAPIALSSPSSFFEGLSPGSVLVGNVCSRYASLCASFAGEKDLKLVKRERPSCEALVLAARFAHFDTADLEPLYVRSCDALDNLDHLASRQGMGAEEAHGRFYELLGKTPKSSI